jgi:hypothetical protein
MARPSLSYLKNLLLFLLGLPCGVVTGLTALGTSVVLLPPMGFLLGLRGPKANGTALAVTFFAALAGMLSFGTRGDVRWGLGIVLAVGQFAGAIAGQRMLARSPGLGRARIAWTLVVVVIGLVMLGNALGWPHDAVIENLRRHPLPPPLRHWLAFGVFALAVALIVGAASRVMALGGVLLVPTAIYLLHLPVHAAEGTALFVLLLASLPGTLIRAARADLEPQAATWVSVGAVFGALVGAYYAAAVLPSAVLVLFYGVALVLIGLMMLPRDERASGSAP